MKTIVGVLELSSKYRYGLTSRGAPIFLFRPYDETLTDYVVGCSHRDTSRNQIALISVGTDNRGTLIRLFGQVGDPLAEKEALLQHYCPYKTGSPMTTETEEERESLEHWVNFHIDPPGCRDIDDAMSYNPATGQWAITIADVAAAVSEGSPTDLAARAIGATFYDLEGRVLRPMLPPAISEGAGSLLPGERRRGITLFLDRGGSETFGLTWITVDHSFTYDSFKGSILAGVCKVHEDPHDWIEAQMIRYNRAVAALLKQAGAGVLRVQGPGSASASWSHIDPGLGAEAASYESVDPTKDPKDQVHASLGLYCHASSPLRRYADLMNQRVLKAILAGKEPVVTVDPAHLNERAKANRRFSRELTFLTHVTAGRVHEIEVIWLEVDRVWVPAWRRVIRLRHEEPHDLGHRGRIQIFCDPTRRNWKQRILTARVQEIV
jgi:exoribonuclease R